jgi:hypothetical protein
MSFSLIIAGERLHSFQDTLPLNHQPSASSGAKVELQLKIEKPMHVYATPSVRRFGRTFTPNAPVSCARSTKDFCEFDLPAADRRIRPLKLTRCPITEEPHLRFAKPLPYARPLVSAN